MENHGPVAMNAAVWFTILSPVIMLAIGLLGAWLLI